MNNVRTKTGHLWGHDWVTVPLVYTQVIKNNSKAQCLGELYKLFLLLILLLVNSYLIAFFIMFSLSTKR